MATGYLPETDAGLLAFSSNFASLISANPTSFGLSASDATQYQTRQTAYASALSTAIAPETRGGATVFAKNTAKKALIADTRALVRTIQGTPTVTDQQRYDLGITIRKTTPSPIPAPTTSPEIHVLSTMGRTIKIRLHGNTASGRGRPANVDGATVMTFIGAAPSNNPQDWKFMGNFNKTVCELNFDASVPNGATIWISAFWVGTKMASGPASTPIPCNLPGGVSMAA